MATATVLLISFVAAVLVADATGDDPGLADHERAIPFGVMALAAALGVLAVNLWG